MCEKLSVIKMEEKPMKKLKKKGFTLIELIVVIAILGILAMIAIPRLSGFQESARTKSDLATFTTMDKAVTAAVANGQFPATDSAAAVTITAAVASGAVTWASTNTGVTASTVMGTLIQSPTFQKSTHQTLAAGVMTWSIATDGTITKPTTGF